MAQQVYSVSTLGGNWSQPYLTQRLRSIAQPVFRFRQFVDVKEAIGKQNGDTWLFDKTGNVQTQGGTLVETNTIPETQFVTGQGTGTITEYGNAVPFTAKLQTLGQFQIEPVTEQKLRDDMVKVLESACGSQYVATDYVAVCTATNGVAFTTNGTATATATSDLTAFNVRKIVDYMRKKLIPFYDGQSYVAICSIQSMSGMFNDTATAGWNDLSKYTAEYASGAHMGELGSFYKTRFVEETGYLSNAIGASSLYGASVFFGNDNVYEAVAVPEEIRTKVPHDYGRDMGLAWYALLGFKIVWNLANDSEQHILYVTSA